MMAIRLRVNNHKKAGKLSVAVGDGVGAGDPSRGRFCVFSGVAVFQSLFTGFIVSPLCFKMLAKSRER